MFYILCIIIWGSYICEAILTIPPDINQECSSFPLYPTPDWILIVRQTTPDYWSDQSWEDRNSSDTGATSFCQWSKLENYRSEEGYFTFKFRWPFSSASQSNTWKQTNNPTSEAQDPNTYIPIQIDFPGSGATGWYKGLGKSSSGFTLIQGGQSIWTYAVGQFAEFVSSSNGIRGTPNPYPVVQQVELYVLACPDGYRVSSKDNIDTCVPTATAVDPCVNNNDMANWALFPTKSDVLDSKCPNAYTITRTWSVTDSCGNSDSAVQTITITDSTPPTIEIPKDYSSECFEPDIIDSGSATATDNCDTNVTISHSDEVQTDIENGAYTIARTWTATDSCGNSVQGVQTITVFDHTAPSFPNSPLQQIQFSSCEEIPDLSTLPYPNVTDNCDISPIISYVDTIVEGTGYCPEKTIYRNWTAVDSFGNAMSEIQEIVILDNTAPILTVPKDITILDCKENDNTSVTGYATATDNCPGEISIEYSDYPRGNNEITRTWTASDSCNNYAQGEQIITKDPDVTAPQFDVPLPSTVWCNYTDPQIQNLTDNCNGDITTSVDTKRTSANTNCPDDYEVDFTFLAIDENDNRNTEETYITVQVTNAITWSGIEDIEVNCNANLHPDALGSPSATDQCSRDVPYTWEDSLTSITCKDTSYTFTRTFYAERCIYSHKIQTITIIPVVSCPCVCGICDSENTTCIKCDKNWYGNYCQYPCPVCEPGSYCDDDILGTGVCINPNAPEGPNFVPPASPGTDSNTQPPPVFGPAGVIGLCLFFIFFILIIIAVVCKFCCVAFAAPEQTTFQQQSQQQLLMI